MCLKHPATKAASRVTLDDLIRGDGAPRTHSEAGRDSGGRVDFDPSFYLSTHTAKGESALRIVDFVSGAGQETEEIELGGGLCIKLPGSNKPKLDKVSPAMWMAANGRIFAQLINSGELSSKNDILDYVAYTTKIGELACRFAWQSVLVYV